jgi:uncharacterized glyoxalase superfamily protein PhnB
MDKPTHQLPVNRTMPSCSIIPVLGYPSVPEAIEWLHRTFGFTERWRVGTHRAQMAFGDGAVALTQQRPVDAGQSNTAATVNTPAHSIMVRIADVETHYEHAKQQGANILQAPTDYPYGEKQYTIEDIGGHIWTFSQSIADLAPEEWGGTTGQL